MLTFRTESTDFLLLKNGNLIFGRFCTHSLRKARGKASHPRAPAKPNARHLVKHSLPAMMTRCRPNHCGTVRGHTPFQNQENESLSLCEIMTVNIYQRERISSLLYCVCAFFSLLGVRPMTVRSGSLEISANRESLSKTAPFLTVVRSH